MKLVTWRVAGPAPLTSPGTSPASTRTGSKRRQARADGSATSAPPGDIRLHLGLDGDIGPVGDLGENAVPADQAQGAPIDLDIDAAGQGQDRHLLVRRDEVEAPARGQPDHARPVCDHLPARGSAARPGRHRPETPPASAGEWACYALSGSGTRTSRTMPASSDVAAMNWRRVRRRRPEGVELGHREASFGRSPPEVHEPLLELLDDPGVDRLVDAGDHRDVAGIEPHLPRVGGETTTSPPISSLQCMWLRKAADKQADAVPALDGKGHRSS